MWNFGGHLGFPARISVHVVLFLDSVGHKTTLCCTLWLLSVFRLIQASDSGLPSVLNGGFPQPFVPFWPCFFSRVDVDKDMFLVLRGANTGYIPQVTDR